MKILHVKSFAFVWRKFSSQHLSCKTPFKDEGNTPSISEICANIFWRQFEASRKQSFIKNQKAIWISHCTPLEISKGYGQRFDG
ncbi:MAG: hypothetical protein FD175_883 [Beijerinckiaceae bacterium]|nr:MAG: hypothetical protein FD175_883 [Beijerinckiaceae bacterium]